jgi:glycosyltransferase involved in cell wall biosynthesis
MAVDLRWPEAGTGSATRLSPRSLAGVRIVQAVGWFGPDRVGGTERYVERLTRELVRRGAQVEVAAPDAQSKTPRRDQQGGVAVHRYPTASSLTRDEAQTRVPVRGSEWLRTWLSDTRPDVVHFHTLVPGLEISEVAAARDAGARVLVTSHAPSLAYLCARGTLMYRGTEVCDGQVIPSRCAACLMEAHGLSRALSRAAGAVPPSLSAHMRNLPGALGTALGATSYIAHRRELQNRLFSLVRALVVLTEWARRVVLDNGGPANQVIVNRLGIEPGAVALKSGPDQQPTRKPIRVGYLGRLDPIKGVDDLIAAMSALPVDIPLRLEIRGPDPVHEHHALLAAARALAARDSRVYVGPAVPENEVPAFLASLDVLCCPSRCLEGGPTVAIEAHAVGTPVVGTWIGGLAELVVNGLSGQLIAPGDRASLTRLLRDIAIDPQRTIDHWRAHLPRVRTMSAVADDYEPLYLA